MYDGIENYKKYIVSNLNGVVSDSHISELKHRIKYGAITINEVHNLYKDLWFMKHGKVMPDYKLWYRNWRIKKAKKW